MGLLSEYNSPAARSLELCAQPRKIRNALKFHPAGNASHLMGRNMQLAIIGKRRIAATILLSSTVFGFAGDFTPVTQNKMAQNNQGPCISNCQTSFDICARLRVNSGIARNCESERDFCTQACQLMPVPNVPLTR